MSVSVLKKGGMNNLLGKFIFKKKGMLKELLIKSVKTGKKNSKVKYKIENTLKSSCRQNYHTVLGFVGLINKSLLTFSLKKKDCIIQSFQLFSFPHSRHLSLCL